MNKSLPQPKKSLKSFILEDDAKITDKTAAKITITTAFLAINIAAASHDANAKGHSNHNSHANNLNVANDYGTGYHIGNNPTEANVNSIEDKSVLTAHGNHYNHSDGGGGQGIGLGALVFGVVLGAVTGGLGFSLFGAEGALATASLGSTISGVAMSTGMVGGQLVFVGGGLAGAIGGAVTGLATSGVTEMMTGGLGEGAISKLLDINTGSPHVMPPEIPSALRQEETN